MASCTPSALIAAAKCFPCLTKKQLAAQQIVGKRNVANRVIGGGSGICVTPSAPTRLVLTHSPFSNPSSTTIQISWTQKNSGSFITGYKVSWGTTSGGPYTNNSGTLPVLPRNYLITGLTPGTTYFIVVQAIAFAGCVSPNSAEFSATTTGAAPPPPNGLLNNLAHFYQFQEAASLFADSGTLNPTPLNYTSAGQDFARVAGHVQAFAASYNGANPGNSLGTIAAAPFDFSGDSTGNLSMSYECWFKWSSVQLNGPPQPVFGIVGPAAANQCYILRHTAANTIQWTVVAFGGGSSASVTNAAVADDSWHLFVGGFDFANGRIFMSIDNGAFQTAALATMNSINNTAWTCFNWSAGTNVESVGALSDVGVWKGRVFNASDVANLWNGGAGLPFSQFTT